jgi:xylose dehydrogenase (NAD/NADP)
MHLTDHFDDFTRRDWAAETGAETVRMALVGAGWFTREWALPGFERAANTEPTVVVDTQVERAERLAAKHDLAAALTPEQFHDGVESDHYDAVYVCTPNGTHLPYVETAAAFGKDVLCEKPMEASVERAAELVDVCADAGVTLMIGYRMQTDPVVRRTNELLDAGFLGDVVHVHGNMSQTMLSELDADDADQWRLDADQSGGCAMMDIGIYPLNTTRFLLDSIPERVYATTRSEHEPFAAVDEHVAVHAQFPDGVTALWTASQQAAHDSFLRITGTEGQITLDPAFYEREDRALTVQRGAVTADLDVEQVHQLQEEFQYFATCLLTGRDPHPDGEHGLVDMRIIDAIYEAATTGQPVDVSL